MHAYNAHGLHGKLVGKLPHYVCLEWRPIRSDKGPSCCPAYNAFEGKLVVVKGRTLSGRVDGKRAELMSGAPMRLIGRPQVPKGSSDPSGVKVCGVSLLGKNREFGHRTTSTHPVQIEEEQLRRLMGSTDLLPSKGQCWCQRWEVGKNRRLCCSVEYGFPCSGGHNSCNHA